MYSKEKISALFCEYCKTEDDKVFERLIMECKPMIRILLSKYPVFKPFEDDIVQEVQIKMWKTLRKPDRMRMNKEAPVRFLFYRLWPYLYSSLRTYARMYHVPLQITPAEQEIIEAKEKGDLSWGQIAEQREVDEETVRCMYYIGKQKQRQSMSMLNDTYHDEVASYQATFVDPARRFEVVQVKRLWKKDVENRLFLHPVYGPNPQLSAQVRECFERLTRDELGELDGEESAFGEGVSGNGGGVS